MFILKKLIKEISNLFFLSSSIASKFLSLCELEHVHCIIRLEILWLIIVATTANDNDDWEVAVDTGEFDKRHEQSRKSACSESSNFPLD